MGEEGPNSHQEHVPAARVRRTAVERHASWMRLIKVCVVLISLAGVGVIVWFRVSKKSRMRDAVLRARCRSNLRMIALSCHMYADDHDENFPPDLSALVPDYVGYLKTFSCPSNPSSWQDFRGGGRITEESSSYEYVPGQITAFPDRFILAYEKGTDNHWARGFHVAFVNAHVEFWPAEREEEFQKKLREQREAVKKWRAAGAKVKDMEKFFGKVKETPAHE